MWEGAGKRGECHSSSAVISLPQMRTSLGAGDAQGLLPHGAPFPESSWQTQPHLSLPVAPLFPAIPLQGVFPLLSDAHRADEQASCPERQLPGVGHQYALQADPQTREGIPLEVHTHCFCGHHPSPLGRGGEATACPAGLATLHARGAACNLFTLCLLSLR